MLDSHRATVPNFKLEKWDLYIILGNVWLLFRDSKEKNSGDMIKNWDRDRFVYSNDV